MKGNGEIVLNGDPHWVFIYKGKDGKTYIKMEFESGLDLPSNQETASDMGKKIMEVLGAKFHDIFVRSKDQSIGFIQVGSPNIRESDLQ